MANLTLGIRISMRNNIMDCKTEEETIKTDNKQAKCDCGNKTTSHKDLPFFRETDREYDEYYCGECYGWD